ncbi:hypothetical protein V1514DRAFT_9878 [Lipomyces japonicus]|uniref:uncharacterized protein n=1 Tax=Lipomyces japonicus TaxID=56871 RepID=UPI0034CF0511
MISDHVSSVLLQIGRPNSRRLKVSRFIHGNFSFSFPDLCFLRIFLPSSVFNITRCNCFFFFFFFFFFVNNFVSISKGNKRKLVRNTFRCCDRVLMIEQLVSVCYIFLFYKCPVFNFLGNF